MIIAVLIIVVCIIGGLIIVARKRSIGDTGNSNLLPAIQKGSNESATLSIHDVGDFEEGSGSLPAIQRGGNESATMTVHDINDISPDGALNAREAASDLGGVQLPPGPPIKPPSPNIGDKTSGGTL